jgi:trehalose-phosphatase
MRDIFEWIEKTGLRNIVWLTDLDRTVIDHDRKTGTVAAPQELREACDRLDARTAGFFIVTGRDVDTVDNRIFPGSRFRISAEYNNVARYDRGAAAEHINPVPPWGLIEARMEALAQSRPGLFLKKTDHMWMIHYSRVPDEEHAAVEAALKEPLAALVREMNAQGLGPPLLLANEDQMFQLTPEGSDKGPAVAAIMRHAQANADRKLAPIYFGDHPGDIPAGKAAQAHGGIFVSVGGDPDVIAAADFHLPDTVAARALFAKAAGMDKAPVPPVPGPQP